jgi:integrase
MRTAMPVGEVISAILDALEANHYTRLTTAKYGRVLRMLGRLCDERGGQYTKQLGALFASQTTSVKTGGFSRQRYFDRGRCARLADSYLDTGVVDLSVQRRPRPPDPACVEFASLLAGWEADLAGRGLAESTRRQCRDAARRFLCYAETRGWRALEAIPAAAVADFVVSLTASWAPAGLRSLMSAFRPFLKFARETRLVRAAEGFRFERERLIVEPLSDADMDAVWAVAGSGRITARDRAIVLLALTCGMRACDIVALELGDIDWQANQMTLVQQKTGKPLTLPLPPALGNAISGYLLDGRPATGDRHVFVRSRAPHTALAGHSSIYRVVKKALVLAGVAPDQFGTRMTRHNAASRMLLAKTPAPVISAVLGHADPASTDRYLAVDADAMRRCVLPLPGAALT